MNLADLQDIHIFSSITSSLDKSCDGRAQLFLGCSASILIILNEFAVKVARILPLKLWTDILLVLNRFYVTQQGVPDKFFLENVTYFALVCYWS